MDKNMLYEKFQNKTDSELDKILSDKHKYSKDEVSAARIVLEERTLVKPDLENKTEDLKEPLHSNFYFHQTPSNKVKNELESYNYSDAPVLYSKRVILLFSAIFSTIFGAVLLIANMKQTNNQKGKNQVLIFGILYTIACLLIINMFDTASNLTIIFNLVGAAILNEIFWNKFIGKDFKYNKKVG